MTNYVFIQSERQLWTTGFYDPAGKWQPEKDFGVDEGGAEAAARRVAWLNGGATDGVQALKDLEKTTVELLDLANRFDERTYKDIVEIVRDFETADYPATEITMYFQGLKRALVLFYDDAKPTDKVEMFDMDNVPSDADENGFVESVEPSDASEDQPAPVAQKSDLSNHEIEVLQAIYKKVSNQVFTVDSMFPTVKRGRYFFDRLQTKGYLIAGFKDEKVYTLSAKGLEVARQK